ncbi:MAG: DUF1127 domain-containing protein [Mesorhizobium sp.]|nr:MAG: DUF1127 domain-containing protein [Mesorhizobium sp.]TGT93181.1 DUF1127 domain-containing protein [Mesorhizobium sp. M5C.F.Ca.ET.164.01.1.1]RWB80006.1 MAG: DUF1127 domain-containing protein [Mesorhizobium sp.]RWC18094.1 MAG: DUF1127 domain-containing protein [Mesorhizobium sp.]RWC33446.1 MAG: DUF1127 domain-containing protein [Mesorhizobium sp.]
MVASRVALHSMPDHLLNDMGIGRSEIDHVTSLRFTIANSAQRGRLNAK